MVTFLRTRLLSFRYALAGWGYLLRTQPNARIHAGFTLAVLLVSLWLNLPARDWALIIFAIALVWTAESINTAIETIIDLVSPKPHPLAKISKDVSAGAVLIAALAAIIIGLLVLVPPLWARLVWLMH